MDIAFLIGRIILGGFFAFSGLNHFMQLEGMSGYAASKGLPMPKAGVIVSGLMLVAGGVLLILGIYPLIAVILLVAFLIPTSFMMHDFWAVPAEQKQGEMTNFMKNMALAGALLMILAIPEPWPGALM